MKSTNALVLALELIQALLLSKGYTCVQNNYEEKPRWKGY